MKIATCVIPVDGALTLLGMKARGFGAGYFNGYGGKKEPDETILQTAVRELYAENSLVAKVSDLEPVGIVTFHFPHKPENDHLVHFYKLKKWTGTPTDTEEMINHTWFSELPYDKMWPADKVLFPVLMVHNNVIAEVYFNKEKGFDRVEFTSPFVKVVRP